LSKLAGGANPPADDSKNGQPRQGRWIKGSVHQIQRRCGVTIPDTPRETSRAMVLRLSLDVLTNRFALGSAHDVQP
jgi:hypothetical protein